MYIISNKKTLEEINLLAGLNDSVVRTVNPDVELSPNTTYLAVSAITNALIRSIINFVFFSLFFRILIRHRSYCILQGGVVQNSTQVHTIFAE